MNPNSSSTYRHTFPGKGLASLLGLLLLLLSSSAFAETTTKPDTFAQGWEAYQSGNFSSAMQFWMPLAEQGDANAQLNVGLMYDAGQGVSVDHARAAEWYRKSAESGLAAAQYNLGLLYRDGEGVEQNQQLSSDWLGRAADQGLQAARAMLDTGLHSVNEKPAGATLLNRLEGASTGTAWSVAGGYAVTSEHVVAGESMVELYDFDGQRYPATIVLRDTQNDIALLRIDDAMKLPPALPLSHKRARTGSSVFTLGFPRVDILGRTPKLSTGIISAINGYRDNPGTYQTSVQIQPGNSGGPLLNMNGEVVGIVAAMLGDNSGSTSPEPGLSYAVKIEKLHDMLEALPRHESKSHQLPDSPADLADLAERVQNSVLLVVAAQ